ncbi:uncharacterized protein LOC124944364 [Impatiens glandulifera]|uniref:uncharacterized protein LOC124944364 n=1 Tax=Impatiens glandulifera TaxID=253017 RepID=UPI001FB079E7|nr:uncharacterized protein LOC124944364 [Impatiens glandulifera]
MAKESSKERRNRRRSRLMKNMEEEKKNEISVTNISISVPHPDHSANHLSYPVTTDGQMLQSETEEAKDASDCFSGYIFMCNASTKPECYRYRVFGLPAGKRDVVEKIKTGMKLFLYDFDSKLLYGVYEASCDGQLNLEPYAFGGKYPAQVKFSIHKECLPLPERVLKRVIEGNYRGFKFNQELSDFYVRNLMSSFRPLAVESPIPPIALERQISLPQTNNSYHVGIQPNASLAINPYQDRSGHHGTMLNHVRHSMEHLSLPRSLDNPYYEVDNRPTYLHRNVPQQMLHDPSLRINERTQNTRLNTHYPAMSYYQEREPYLKQPIGGVPADITLYQSKYSKAVNYLPVSQPTASSDYGIPNYLSVSQSTASSDYGIPNYQSVSQPTASSHSGIPNYLSVSQPTASSDYGIPNYLSVSQPTASSDYGIPNYQSVSQPTASSRSAIPNYLSAPQPTASSDYGIPNYQSVSQPTASSHSGIPNYLSAPQPTASSDYVIPNYLSVPQPTASSDYIPNYLSVSQPTASSDYGIPNYQSVSQPTASSHYGIPNYLSVSQPTASSHYGIIPGHVPVSSYHFQHGP